MISATIDIEAARLLEYLRQVREAMGQHVAPMDLVGRAADKVLEALPALNGRVVFGSFRRREVGASTGTNLARRTSSIPPINEGVQR